MVLENVDKSRKKVSNTFSVLLLKSVRCLKYLTSLPVATTELQVRDASFEFH